MELHLTALSRVLSYCPLVDWINQVDINDLDLGHSLICYFCRKQLFLSVLLLRVLRNGVFVRLSLTFNDQFCFQSKSLAVINYLKLLSALGRFLESGTGCWLHVLLFLGFF